MKHMKSKINKKPNRNSYDRLIPEQKAFIENKVKELGSMEAVMEHYVIRQMDAYGINRSLDEHLDLVSRYARSVARKMYK